MTEPTTELGRREFFRTCGRYAALAALTAGAILLGTRRRHPGPVGQTCPNSGLCGDCDRSGGCGLPQAISARAAQKRVMAND